MPDQFNFFGGQKLSYEKRQQMKLAINRIFKNSDPFGVPFQDSIKEKLLLYLQGFHLNKRQFEALIKTIKTLGETSFYVSRIEGSDLSEIYDIEHRDYPHWEFSTETPYEKYSTIGLTLENALYSSSGKWGVIISNEDHAIIGGTDEFMTLFTTFYPYWDYDLRRCIQMWKYAKKYYKSDISWVPNFLKYINAPIKSRSKIDPEKWHQIMQALMSVFKELNDYGENFQDSIQAKLLLFPTNGCYLNKKQFEALLKVLKEIGESSFYMSQINAYSINGLLETEGEQEDHFELRSDISYEEYQKNLIIFENILYSKKGTWGLFISQEGYAIIGGSQEFIELFKKYYPQWEDDEKAFIKMWEEKNKQNGIDISWMPKLLEYVNISKKNKNL